MPADLRLVAHATERHAHELPPERPRDRFRQRGLSDARRTGEAQDRTLDVRIQLANSEVLEDAVFRFFEPRVIRVENVLRLRKIDDFVRALLPRQRHQPIHVGARDGVLRCGDRHPRQAIQLPQRFLADGLGHPGRIDLLLQLLDVLGLVVALAELFLNRLELLAQKVLALVAADFRLHLRLDLGSQFEDLELFDEDAIQRIHALTHIELLEHLLLHGRRDRGEARGDEVRETSRLGDVGGQRLQVVGEQRRQRDDLLKTGLDVPQERVDLEALAFVERLGSRRDATTQIRARCDVISSSVSRDSPWTIRRRLPSGSLNILWTWLAVPTV